MQINAQSLAIEALAIVQTQPASTVETKERARRQLHEWQSQLSPQDFAAAVELGSAGDAKIILQRVLTHMLPAT